MPYNIQYLRSFQRDYDGIIDYITLNLGAPGAAARLTEELFETVDRVADFPYIYKLFIASRPLAVEYRTFAVGSYAVFYAVDEQTRTVRFYRMLYGRRDFDRLL